MIILTPITTAQEVNVYVRDTTGSTFNVIVIDESLNSTDTNVVSGTITDYILTLDVTYNFVEGRFYGLKIYNGTDLINFSKIYCTEQTDLENYSVTDSYYTQIDKTETTYVTK